MWRCSIIVVAAALVAAIGCGKKDRNPDKDIQAVPLDFGGRPDSLERWAIQAQVRGIKPYLKSPKSPERITAINGLACLKNNPEAVQLLLEVAHGTNSQDAGFAILSLARLRAPEAKAEIERAFESEDVTLRRDACMAIGEYGDKALYPLLARGATDSDATVRKATALAEKRLK